MNRFFNLFAILFLATAFHAKAQYITVWKTDNPGASADNQIIIPATGTNYSIAWEEVGNAVNNGTATGSGSYLLTFPFAGIYQVSIIPGSGTFDRINFSNTGDKSKILEVKQWGEIQWSTMAGAYSGCANLTVTAPDIPNLQNVYFMASMFASCLKLTDVPNINQWDVSRVVDMSNMFQSTLFNSAIQDWDVSDVRVMSDMFSRASRFNQPLEKWDVSSVFGMNNMFGAAASFNQPIGSWNVSKVTSMVEMFNGARAFNQPLENWNVSNVTHMSFMLRNSAFNQPIGGWEIRKVTYMTDMLDGSAMDCMNMTQTLQGWAADINTSNNITFGASDRTYGSEGAAALKILRDNKSWNITIGSQVACTALDVSLIRFDAHQEAGKVKLEWATANETDNDYFEIERSENALNWQVVNRIKGAGTVTSAKNYSVTDSDPLGGTSYYRLKYVDLSGIAGYSRIRAINTPGPASHDLYPNPATTSITISGKPEGHLKMYNLSGLEVLQTEIKAEKQQISVGQLPAGTYIIKMDDGWNAKYIKR
ncbi:BspA family leucine-rich repeat surface protein [Dyadobacter psychrotolerans]|uniref:BspA family leucine-rich repeat surface protein n=1 Tax=Dyadobacter psychrotolerans TaxID=2541721 RepID=A0A4R5DMU5_9BACT|nr:BspA family leucine-rich repeat surface protein [Dyadobacter psychrotolerans]TDE15622.1 BspA family leucine-rich repeat surface protein [Dyadobacter psychrotolerans]